MWMNTAAPSGWLKLRGGTFDITKYPKLHKYLQETKDYKDGVLPDWKGLYPGGLGGHLSFGLGEKADQQTAQPSGGAPRSSVAFPDGGTRTFTSTGNTNAYSDSRGYVVVDTGWDSVTRPPSVAVHFIIKHD